MLYKKDFKAIAEIIREAKEDYRGGTPTGQVLVQIEDNLVDYLTTQNPRFDANKFLSACAID